MTAILSLLPIFGYALIFHILARKKVSVSIFFAISSIIVAIFILGMLDLLKFGTYFVFYGGILSLGYFIYAYKDKVLQALISIPVVVYFLSSILYLYLMQDAAFFFWDEYSHWGAFIKEMYYFGHFYDSSSVAAHLRYPPGISIWDYFIVLPTGFSEGSVYFAYFLLLFSSVLMMYENLIWKQFYWMLLIFASQMTLFATFGHWFSCIYVDHIVGAMFAGMLLSYLVEKYEAKELLLFILPAIAIVLIKEIGLFFVLSFIGLIILIEFYNTKQNNPILFALKKSSKIIFVGFIIFTISFLALKLWNLKQDSLDVPMESQTISAIVKNIISGEKVLKPESEQLVHERFWEVVKHQQLHKEEVSLNYNEFSYGIMNAFKKDIKLSTLGTLIFFTLISLFYYLVLIDEKDKNKILIINLYLLVVSVSYLIILYLSYKVAFGEDALRVPSYVRYMNISILPLLLILFFILVPASNITYNHKLFKGRAGIGLYSFAALLSVLIYVTQPYYKPLYTQLENPFRKQVDAVVPAVLKNIPYKSKLLVVFTIKNNGSLNNILKYSMIPVRATITSHDYFFNKSENEILKDYIKYEYVWFATISQDVMDKNRKILRVKEANQPFTLYKVEKQNNQIQLQPVL